MKIVNNYRWTIDYKLMRQRLREQAESHGMTYIEYAEIHDSPTVAYAIMTDTGKNHYDDSSHMFLGSFLGVCTTYDLDPRHYLCVVRQ